MAYTLKTTGLATSVVSLIAVDDDGTTIKDFASSAVTADMTIETGVTIGSRTRNGNTRYYIEFGGSGFDPVGISFGTNKPAMPNGSGSPQLITILIFANVGSGGNVQFFFEGSHYRIGRDGGSGKATAQAWGSNLSTNTIPNDGTTAYGIATRFDNNTTCTHYYGIETGGNAFELLSNGTWTDGNTGSDSGNMTFLGGSPGQGYIPSDLHAIIQISADGVSDAEVDSVFSDWVTALLDGGGDDSAALSGSAVTSGPGTQSPGTSVPL